MRSLTIRFVQMLLLPLTLGACSPQPDPGTQRTERAADAARVALGQDRADVMRRLGDLEAAVADARREVATLESAAGARPRAEQLTLSETRRAIVVANVSLQKARTAVVAGDLAAARTALEGSADRLRTASRAKPLDAPSSSPPAGR